MKKLSSLLLVIIFAFNIAACDHRPTKDYFGSPDDTLTAMESVVWHAKMQTNVYCTYNGAYRSIKYPGGDFTISEGVCTDVVIRALRAGNIDLQKLIHEDMKRDLPRYNRLYKTKVVDANIDHRRTQNIQTLFRSLGDAKLRVGKMTKDEYKPGDILFWDVAAGHTGIVSDVWNPDHSAYLVIHNIGGGPQYEDILSYWGPTDGYRLEQPHVNKLQAYSDYKHDWQSDPYLAKFYANR